MKKLPNIFDYLAACMVIISIIGIPDNKIFWIPYAVGCFIYLIINWQKKIFGQAVLNIFAMGIAIWNLIK